MEIVPAAPPVPREPSATGTVHRISIDRTRRRVSIPHEEHKTRRLVGFGLFLADVLVILGALYLHGGRARLGLEPGDLVPLAALMVCLWLPLYVVGGYRRQSIHDHQPLKSLAAAGFSGMLIGLIAYKLLFDWLGTRETVVRFTYVTIAAPVAMAAWAAAMRWLVGMLLRRVGTAAKVLFIGPAEVADELRTMLHRQYAATPLVTFSVDGSSGSQPLSALGAEVTGAVKAIVLGVPVDSLPQAAVEELVHARLIDVPIISPSRLIEDVLERTPITLGDHGWMLQEDGINPGRSIVYLNIKRLIDLAVAGVALVLASPVMLVVAIAVRLTSPGPVFFTQVREGRWAQPFTIYKFRTMRADAEADGPRWATVGDARVTRIGAFLRRSRLDELPQLINVLIGDMSLVGPRPERPEFNRMLVDSIPWYDLRHLAMPGLTGWAQVRYPYGASIPDAVAKLEYEIYYLKNASLRFDIRILLRTIAIVCGLRGR